MNLNINYYAILNSNFESPSKDIKKNYYNLSKKYHPDVNKDESSKSIFQNITEAWSILGDDSLRIEYDKKSKFGKNYNEYEEFFKIDMEYNHKEAQMSFDRIKNQEILDIIINVDMESFDGSIEFPRFVICKKCKGNGKNMSTKIAIKDLDGKMKYFESDDECFVCEGEGKDRFGETCLFCNGKGKVGINPCETCNGDGRTLGKQRLKDIKFDGEEKKIECMGHYNKGRVGNLIIRKL